MTKYVREIMKPRPPVTLTYNAPIREAIALMDSKDIDCVLVEPHESGGPWRIFTTIDQFRVDTNGVARSDPVGPHSSVVVYFVTPDSTKDDCKAKMALFRIHHLPVFSDTQKSKPIGMVSQEDIKK